MRRGFLEISHVRVWWEIWRGCVFIEDGGERERERFWIVKAAIFL